MFPEYLQQIGPNLFMLKSGVYSIDTEKGVFGYETIGQYVARKNEEEELERIFNL